MRQVSLHILFGFLWIVWKRMQHFNNQIPEIKGGTSIHSQTCIKRNNFRFCWTVRNSSLFLAHPTYWNKCMASKNAQCSSRSGFWVLKVSCKIGVLKQSQSALLCSISHMTILFVFTCMMNIWNQSIQAFVTGLGPFCDWSCKFVHWPENIRSSNTCQVQAFQDNLRAYLWQFSNRCHFFFLEVVVIVAWCRYFVELLCRLVCQLTIPFHTFLCMTFHITRPRRNTKILRVWKFFSSHPRKFMILTWLCDCPQSLLISHCLWVQPKYTWSKKDVGSPKSTSLSSTFHIGSRFRSFPANFMSSTCTEKNIPFSPCTHKHSQLETFSSIQIPFKRNDWVFHTGPWFGPFVSW